MSNRIPLNLLRLTLPTMAAAALLAGSAESQTLFGMDEFGQTIQFNGPETGPCSYPNGPLLSLWQYTTTHQCAPDMTLVPAAPSLVGDLTVDRSRNTTWVTDGSLLGEFSNGGNMFNAFILPVGAVLSGPITGLGAENVPGLVLPRLWITDGDEIASLTPPPEPGCAAGTVFAGVFNISAHIPGTATDIEYDPTSGTLWVCDDAGFVTNLTTSGTPGPFGSVSASAASPCGLGTTLQGLAVDTASTTGKIYVTDGANVYYMDALAGGGPAPATLYTPSPCNVVPAAGGPLRGLGFTASGNTVGSPSLTTELAPGVVIKRPIIGLSGQSVVPSTSFTINFQDTVFPPDDGIVEGHIAALYASVHGSFFCPAQSVLGTVLHIVPAPQIKVGVFVLPESEGVQAPIVLTPSFPVRVAIQFQWFTVDPMTITVNSTRGLGITTALP